MAGKTQQIKRHARPGAAGITKNDGAEGTAVVGIYSSHTAAEASVKGLQMTSRRARGGRLRKVRRALASTPGGEIR